MKAFSWLVNASEDRLLSMAEPMAPHSPSSKMRERSIDASPKVLPWRIGPGGFFNPTPTLPL